MSPLNRGPLMGPRILPSAMRPPMPRFGTVPSPPPPLAMTRGLPPPGMSLGMPRGMPPPPMNPMFGPRGRPIPPPPRPRPMMNRPSGPPGPPIFGPRSRPIPPMPPMPPMGLPGPMGMHGPMVRPGSRGILPPHVLPHMRPRFPPNHINGKGKSNTNKKANKLEELELKKPWMTDEIRSEIQKKNRLYAKAKKNKDAKEWDEFKDLRNKVTRMIRDAKNEYLAKNPDQVAQKTADKSTIEKESVQKTENTTEQTEQMELNEENKPSSEQIHLYENDAVLDENSDDINELSSDSEEEPTIPYCEVCDRNFQSEEMLQTHTKEHKTCKIDGCTFTAHPKIVEKHISMQHSTGLYERMKNLAGGDDVEKWLSDRKKRYPTAINIELKNAEKLEKKNRGEVIKLNDSRDLHKKGQLRKTRKRKRNRRFEIQSCENIIEKKEIYRGLLPFAGIGMLDEEQQSDDSCIVEKTLVDSNIEVVDETQEQAINELFEQSINNKEQLPNIEVSRTLSLVADYKSESDYDDLPDELPIKKSNLTEDTVCQNFETKDVQTKLYDPQITEINSGVDSIAVLAKNKKSKNISETNNKGNNNTSRFLKTNNSVFQKGKLRLLNKLLSRSIQHERNVICQCITFIAKDNFLNC